MATPSEKLADSLEALQALQDQGQVAIKSSNLSRTHRERLVKNGFIREVMKGWYIPSHPEEVQGESTAWYASFWDFCAAYLNERFGTEWCLSPEQSICFQAGDKTVPGQLLVRTPKGRNNITELVHGTSILEVRATLPDAEDTVEIDGLRLYSITSALITCAPGAFEQKPTEMRAALSMVTDASDILSKLLDGGHSVIAGRVAGAFRNIERNRIADNILETMRAAGYTVRETDPFDTKTLINLPERERSPYVNRTRLMWAEMREQVIEVFPEAPGRPNDINAYLEQVDEIYVTDAYHSLSIEGYRVSPELIEQVRSGNWNPDANKADQGHQDALAARGYYQAFQAVKESAERVLKNDNPGEVVEEGHGTWYREMFAPSAVAGIIRPTDLAGYRSGPVYIRQSKHVPPSREAVRDLMPAFFELLQQETNAAVRVVLGHFVFVYIHPYTDGNGRMGRFLMNVMLAAGGYPWTVVPLEKRDAYMAALEDASVGQNIEPFTRFLASLVEERLKGAPAPEMPNSKN
jgi:Fic/DOC family